MRIVVIPAEDLPRTEDIPEEMGAQLDAVQRFCGGYVEAYVIPKYPQLVMLAGEDAHMQSRPLNTVAAQLTGFPIKGDVVLAMNWAGSDELASVPDDLVSEFVGA